MKHSTGNADVAGLLQNIAIVAPLPTAKTTLPLIWNESMSLIIETSGLTPLVEDSFCL
jgi:hypothetical protein